MTEITRYFLRTTSLVLKKGDMLLLDDTKCIHEYYHKGKHIFMENQKV